MKWLPIGTVVIVASVSATYAQQVTDNNPGHAPDAVLDNHRPLIQKREKPATTRTVSGKVVDGSGQPLEGALVTLTNTATKERREYFTKQDGRYSFEQLSFTIDYELQARYKDTNGEVKKLSEFDKSPKMVRILEISKTADNAQPVEAKKDTPPAKQ